MITRDEAQKARNERIAGPLARLEALIDEVLVQPAGYGGCWTVATKGYSLAVVELAMERYLATGWLVQRVSDQRDGDYLEFI